MSSFPLFTMFKALLVAALLLVVVPAPAQDAQPAEKESKNHVVAGFGLEMAYPFGGDTGDLLAVGSGANVSAGYEMVFGSVRVLAGVVGAYLYFPSNLRGVREEDVDLKSVQASISGGYVVPFADEQALVFDVFVHLGAGYLTASSVDEGGQTDTGFAYDVGVTIDYKVIPGLRIGINGGYSQVLATYRDVDSLQWGLTELHFILDF